MKFLKRTPEHCKAISMARTGKKYGKQSKPRSEEHRKKLSDVHKGKHYSPKTELKKGWSSGKYLDAKGYVFILNPGHPFCNSQGYIREHRLVVEMHIGRYLRSEEIVHHINGIKTDNRIENLKIMNNSAHCRLHLALGTAGGRKGKDGKRHLNSYAVSFS